MNSLVYLLLVAGFCIGFVLGWAFRAQRVRQSSAPVSVPLALPATTLRIEESSTTLAISPSTAIHDAEAQRLQMELNLARLNEDIAALQTEIKARQQEYSRLLNDLDDHQPQARNSQKVSSSMGGSNQPGSSKTEAILSSMDESGEELDALQEMHDAFQVRINRLTQQVQRQDDTLHILYQTLRSKTEELNEAQALLDRRESEWQRIIRQRKQRDQDIARELDLLKQRDETFQDLLQKASATQPEDEVAPSEPIMNDDQVPIAPPSSPLPLPDDGSPVEPDDLTEIVGLGKLYADQLRLHGIETFEHLARSRPEDIQRMLEIPGHFSPDIRRWIATAKQIVAARRNK